MAAKKKCPECEEGAPSWLVSYGDMVTLLLCFFVFLLVTAKVDVDKLSAASGYMAERMGLLPNSRAERKKKELEEANAGVSGQDQRVQTIDDGKVFIVGLKEMFKKNDAVLQSDLPEVAESLLEVAREVRGLLSIIEVRGHTGRDEKGEGIYRDAMDLSLERARAVRDFLVNYGNINEERVRIVGCSYHERYKSTLYYSTENMNRRVEVRVTEKFIDLSPNTHE